MSRDERAYADEAYEERREDDYGDAEERRSTWRSYAPTGWWPTTAFGRTGEGAYDEDAYRDEPSEGPYDQEYHEEDQGTWLDEGLITLLIVAGAILFLFPEPATSGLGVVLLIAGVVLWAIDWAI